MPRSFRSGVSLALLPAVADACDGSGALGVAVLCQVGL